jgi:hypothetical protein
MISVFVMALHLLPFVFYNSLCAHAGIRKEWNNGMAY